MWWMSADNGTLEGAVTYDGRTNRAFGQRAVAFNAAGDVQIPNNPAFEFTGGNGTIEALIYLERGAQQDGTIFAWAADDQHGWLRSSGEQGRLNAYLFQ